MAKNDQTTVFIVDDDKGVRKSLRWLLGTVDLKSKAFGSAQEFLQNYDGMDGGCLVLDVRMPGMSGLELQGELKRLNDDIPVIFISGHADVSIAVRGMKNGAFDFFEKPFNDQELLDSVHKAINSQTSKRQQNAEQRKVAESFALLTDRERQVVGLLVAGGSSKSIAVQLGVSPKTIDAHRANIMAKTEARSLAHLIGMTLIVGDVSEMDLVRQGDPGI